MADEKKIEGTDKQPKVGDAPKLFRATDGGVDPATLGDQINPPVARDQKPGQDGKTPIRTFVQDNSTVVAREVDGLDPKVTELAMQGEVGERPRYGQPIVSNRDPAGGGGLTGGGDDNTYQGAEKIAAMVKSMPQDTPPDHVFYGYGDHRLTFRDLLQVAEIVDGGYHKPAAEGGK